MTLVKSAIGGLRDVGEVFADIITFLSGMTIGNCVNDVLIAWEYLNEQGQGSICDYKSSRNVSE